MKNTASKIIIKNKHPTGKVSEEKKKSRKKWKCNFIKFFFMILSFQVSFIRNGCIERSGFPFLRNFIILFQCFYRYIILFIQITFFIPLMYV